MPAQAVQGRDPDGEYRTLAVDDYGRLLDGGAASQAVRIDDTTTAGVTYIGKASIGTATSSPNWQVQRLQTSSGLVKSWADGDAQFDNVWDNRATTITYA